MKSPTAIQQSDQRLNNVHNALFWTLVLVMMFMPQLLQAAPVAPLLKAHVTVQGPLVTLADLFENVGLKGSKAVFRAPNPGTTGKVSVNRVLLAARKQGLQPSTRAAFRMVTIKRTSRVIEAEELIELIRAAVEEQIAGRKKEGELIIKLKSHSTPLHIASQIKELVLLDRFNWSHQSGRFSAHFAIGDHQPIQIYGTASQMVQIIVAKTEIAKGKLISSSDLQAKYVQRSRRTRKGATALEDLIGLSAKRRLPAGRPVRLSDLEAPKLITKNQLVTILLEAPGLVLRTQGKALSDATLGETVKVLNTQSKRIIHATAKASGLVFVKLSQPTGSGS